MSEKDYKIVVDPRGIPDNMTQEELNELLEEIDRRIEDGTLFEEAEEVDLDELRETDPELYEEIISRLNDDAGDLH